MTKSAGGKGEACGWERTLAVEPAAMQGQLGSANSSGWCRGPTKTNMRTCTGKGSVVVVDALNGDNAVPGVKGSSPMPIVWSLKGTGSECGQGWGPES